MTNPFSAVLAASRQMAGTLVNSRSLLVSITGVELKKKYAGSVLGMGWVVLQPALMLSVYLFIYLVVFKVKFPGLSTFGYVLYVFTGLVPYLGFMEALTAGGLSLKQNMHFVKNVMLPIELIPVRSVLVGMTSQLVSLTLVLLMVAATRHLSPHVIWLPVIVLLQVMALVGLTWILASLTVALPDVTYFVNLLVSLLMWLSPIGFTPEMVPERFRIVIYLNPVSYMIEAYRATILDGRVSNVSMIVAYGGGSFLTFALGATLFRAFKGTLVDFE